MSGKDPSPADKLGADISALEADIADSQRTLADLETSMHAAEARAIQAIRAGDDYAARVCLLEQQAHAEKVAAFTADLKVLGAILDECRELANREAAK